MLLSPNTYIMHLTSVADCRQLCFIRLSPPHRDRAVTERLLKPPKDGGDGTGMVDFKRERRTTSHTGAARIGKPS